MTNEEYESVKKYNDILQYRKLGLSDYAMPEIRRLVDIYFRDLQNVVMEQIEEHIEDFDVENGIPKLCKSLIKDVFQEDEDLNY